VCLLGGNASGKSTTLKTILGVCKVNKGAVKLVNQAGITLSGGEQQMLAMGRALLSNPDVLLMDEPSMGLSPLLVDQQFELIQKVNRQGTTIFMAEQNANMALSIADRGYVLQTGSIVLSDSAEDLLCNEMMQEA
jgi:branched-chain amino acid transport system ATP-binding protein